MYQYISFFFRNPMYQLIYKNINIHKNSIVVQVCCFSIYLGFNFELERGSLFRVRRHIPSRISLVRFCIDRSGFILSDHPTNHLAQYQMNLIFSIHSQFKNLFFFFNYYLVMPIDPIKKLPHLLTFLLKEGGGGSGVNLLPFHSGIGRGWYTCWHGHVVASYLGTHLACACSHQRFDRRKRSNNKIK